MDYDNGVKYFLKEIFKQNFKNFKRLVCIYYLGENVPITASE